MVTPMIFNLDFSVRSDAFDIEAVYGSPEADQATGQLMKVNTLFPAPVEEDAVKGGVILLKLKRKGPGNDLQLNASYEDRSGKKYRTTITSLAPAGDGEFCPSPDLRKAVLLARFVRLMKDWIQSVRGPLSGRPESAEESPNYWEHSSFRLQVSDSMAEKMRGFHEHMKDQMKQIGDPSLERELNLLKTIIGKVGNKK